MGTVNLPPVEPMGSKSLEQYVKYLADVVAIQQEEIQNLLEGRLSTVNIREIAGWLVSQTKFVSKDGDVGLSTEDTGGDDIRFFAGPGGSLWSWYVTKGGEMVAQKATIKGHIDAETGTIGGWTIEMDKLSGEGTIEGGTIRTAPENNQRIEMSSGGFTGYTAGNKLNGLVFDPNKVTEIVDLFLYHNGTKLVEFFDDLNKFIIRGVPGAVGFGLGGNNVPTYAYGPWSFVNATSVTGIPQSGVDGLISALNSIYARLSALESRP